MLHLCIISNLFQIKKHWHFSRKKKILMNFSKKIRIYNKQILIDLAFILQLIGGRLFQILLYFHCINIFLIPHFILIYIFIIAKTNMSLDSNDQTTNKRFLQDGQDQEDGQEISKPIKKIKKHKSEREDSEDRSTSETHKQKHKKHKKSKSKHKKHKEKSEKKHKHKDKKSKHKKQKHKKQSDEDSDKQQKQDEQLPSQPESLTSEQLKKKLKKIKHSTSKDKKSTPGKIRRISRKKDKKDQIVSASQDQGKPISLENKSDGSQNEHKVERGQKKKRGRKPRSESKPQKAAFQIDDVINLDQDEGGQERKGDSTSKISKKKIDRLTKIKQPVIKNIIVTKNVENVPVDHHFSKFNECHVLEMGGCFYNATLTQSNIVRDDNKFFIIQILQMNHNEEQFYVYSRWGRVGVTGQISELGPLNRQASIRHYNQVVQNKIKIGHYKVVEMNYDDYDTNKKQKGNKQLEISSKLDLRIQDLIKLIFDIRMMNSHMKEIGYDQKRLPLGKLGEKAITDGYNTLNKLLTVINQKAKETFQKKKQINQLSGLFYQCIPHDFGYMNMQTFVLDTQQKIKQKLEILSSLQQIQIYNSLINQKMSNPELSEIDQKYFRLNISISPIIKGSQIWKKLIKYVQNTHAKTHNKYDLQVEQIYELKKEEMDAAYKGDIGNKILLWHGSRLTNYVGILSKGLKIAPLQAPSTGYMFGKGIYFADMVSKSANYCLATKINNIGLVLLCEVALGGICEKQQSDYSASNLPSGKHSIKGMGKTEPMGGQYLQGDVWIPNGKAQPSGVVDSTLLYNQFVVYDPRQIRYRYLFRFKFHFKESDKILPGIRV